jgi:hypothetical protein
MSQELFKHAAGEKHLRILEGAHHRNCLEVGGDAFQKELKEFMTT